MSLDTALIGDFLFTAEKICNLIKFISMDTELCYTNLFGDKMEIGDNSTGSPLLFLEVRVCMIDKCTCLCLLQAYQIYFGALIIKKEKSKHVRLALMLIY